MSRLASRLALWLAVPVLSTFSPPSTASADGPVRHELSFPRVQNQYVHVESRFPATGEALELAMPVWTPGSYLVREYSAHIEHIEAADAADAAGSPLPLSKTAKNRWRVEHGGADEVRVTYDVWAGQLDVSTNWVSPSFALLNGAGLFLYTDASRGTPQEVTVRLPDDWPRVHAALAEVGPGPVFLARDYDELVDSPFLAGDTVEHRFEVRGRPYGLILVREEPFWDVSKSADDVARIVQAQKAFWGVDPFDRRYLFLTVFYDRIAGLEHDHSTVMMIDPWAMRDAKDYQRWLGLVSHEFFHAWNVRRMRPAALSNYDYEGESYVRELWLAEGLTSYYDELLLFRSGLIGVGDYFDLLAKEIRDYETTPGREVRSAELASFDTWIKHYRQDGNSVNSTVSYYRKGAVIGFVTDTAIRRETKGEASLDDVMRLMFQRFGDAESGGYPRGAFEAVVEELAGKGVREVVEALIHDTGDPDVDSALAWYGLKLDRGPAENGQGESPPGFGIEVRLIGDSVAIEQVVSGRTGADAGLLPGDELLAVGGRRITAENYDALLERLNPGETIDVLLSRSGQIVERQVEVGEAIPAAYRITTEKRLGSRQKARLENWLGRELLFK